ncbi:DUF4227 family protein [Paenibacillus sp. CMAA1364]
MVISLRKGLNYIRFVLVFLAFSYLLFRLFSMFGYQFNPVDQYRVPQGYAVKVFQLDDLENEVHFTMAERLRIFYWYGE